MRPISEKQKQILQFIQEYTASEGYPPAVREIAAAVGLRSLPPLFMRTSSICAN